MSRELLRLYDQIVPSVGKLSLEVERAEVQIVHGPEDEEGEDEILIFANRPGHWAVFADGKIRQLEAEPHRLYHAVVDSLPCEVESFFQWFLRKLSWGKKKSAQSSSPHAEEVDPQALLDEPVSPEEIASPVVEPAFVIDRLEIRVPSRFHGGLTVEMEEGSLALDFWRGGNFTLNGSGYTVVTGGDVSQVETLKLDLAGDAEVRLGALEVERVEFFLDDNSSIKADSCKCETAQITQVDGEGSVIIPHFEVRKQASCALEGQGEFSFAEYLSAERLQVNQGGSSTLTLGTVVTRDSFDCSLEDEAALQAQNLDVSTFSSRQEDSAELNLGVLSASSLVKMRLFQESSCLVKNLSSTSGFSLQHESGGEARIVHLTTEGDVELTLSGEGNFSGDELVCRHYRGTQDSSGEIKLEKLRARASLVATLEGDGGLEVTSLDAPSVKVTQKSSGEVEVDSLTANKEVIFTTEDEGGFHLKRLDSEAFTLELTGGAEVEVENLEVLTRVDILSHDTGEVTLGKVNSASFRARHKDGGSLDVGELNTEELTIENEGSTEINIKGGATKDGVVINKNDGSVTLGRGFTSVRVRSTGDGEVSIGW